MENRIVKMLCAARHNPSIQSIYRRLKEAGKPEKVARIAAARKLLLIAHAVYKSGESYRDPNIEHEFRRNSQAARRRRANGGS